MKKTTLTLLVIASALAMATPAMAQANTNSTWRGQDNEFGSIRAPYSVDVNGQRAEIQAQIFIRDLYTEKDGRFYMFQFNMRGMPLDVTLDQIVRTDTGETLTCYQKESDAEGVKCTVDLKQMPPENTEIVMYGTVGAHRTGTFNVGAMVIPFTATWEPIRMSSGLDAELYAGTQVLASAATSGSNRLGGIGNLIPAPGMFGLVGAVIAAAAIAATVQRRRKA